MSIHGYYLFFIERFLEEKNENFYTVKNITSLTGQIINIINIINVKIYFQQSALTHEFFKNEEYFQNRLTKNIKMSD